MTNTARSCRHSIVGRSGSVHPANIEGAKRLGAPAALNDHSDRSS